MVLRWLKSGDVPKLSLRNLVERCRKLLNSQWEVQVSHVFHECNRVADLFASATLSLDRGFYVMDEPPASAQIALLDDILGVTWPRRVAII